MTKISLLGIKKNVLLKNHTTFKIGGPAKYFFIAKTKNNLIAAVKWAKECNLPFFILGGGSNVLVSDKGFPGLVIRLQFSNFIFQDSELYAQAGAELNKVVKSAAEKGLTGIEWMIGIPKATVGGAVRNNAGAFGNSMKEIVKTAEIFDVLDSKIKNFNQRACKFSYKKTIFKQNKNLIILSCLLKLKKGDKKEIRERIKYFLNYREKNHPMEFPSAGCIFENPRKIRAAELIEKCGLKGRRIGGAEISQKHANFVVNLGRASSEDVLELINLIKNKVKNKFAVILKEEIQYLGF